MKNTVFEGSHLSVSQLLCFFYCCAHGIVSYNDLRRETSNYSVVTAIVNDNSFLTRTKSQTASHTSADWISFCCKIIFVDLVDNKMGKARIGGPRITVEVHETKVGRPKHIKCMWLTPVPLNSRGGGMFQVVPGMAKESTATSGQGRTARKRAKMVELRAAEGRGPKVPCCKN